MRKRIGRALAWMAMAGAAWAGDTVSPPTVTFTNVRSEAIATIVAGTIYQGSSLVFTNCKLYSGTSTNSDPQGLSNVTVEVSCGNLGTNVDYTATVTSTNLGLWCATVTVPSLSAWQVQVRITDAATNRYVYPTKTMVADQSMF
jgi:hypothetical protein